VGATEYIGLFYIASIGLLRDMSILRINCRQCVTLSGPHRDVDWGGDRGHVTFKREFARYETWVIKYRPLNSNRYVWCVINCALSVTANHFELA